MNRVHDNFVNGIITQNKYNNNMLELDNILYRFKELPRNISIQNYNLINKKMQ